MAEILHAAESSFESILKENKIVLVDFWATWCGPCRMVAPIMEQLADHYAGKLKSAKVDVDENPGLASKFGIMSIPTVILFKDGQAVMKDVGARSFENYCEMIDAKL